MLGSSTPASGSVVGAAGRTTTTLREGALGAARAGAALVMVTVGPSALGPRGPVVVTVTVDTAETDASAVPTDTRGR